MLILRRRAGESLLIGDDVEIEILEAAAWGVKVGIRAPKGICILRKELKATADANCAAAQLPNLSDLRRSVQLFSELNSRKDHRPR